MGGFGHVANVFGIVAGGLVRVKRRREFFRNNAQSPGGAQFAEYGVALNAILLDISKRSNFKISQ